MGNGCFRFYSRFSLLYFSYANPTAGLFLCKIMAVTSIKVFVFVHNVSIKVQLVIHDQNTASHSPYPEIT